MTVPLPYFGRAGHFTAALPLATEPEPQRRHRAAESSLRSTSAPGRGERFLHRGFFAPTLEIVMFLPTISIPGRATRSSCAPTSAFLDTEATVSTDDSRTYQSVPYRHESVKHSMSEYVEGEASTKTSSPTGTTKGSSTLKNRWHRWSETWNTSS